MLTVKSLGTRGQSASEEIQVRIRGLQSELRSEGSMENPHGHSQRSQDTREPRIRRQLPGGFDTDW
jgi:hypothetical protein